MLMLPRSVLTRMWSPSCVGTEPVKSEVRRLSAWVGLGGAGSRRAEALTATISTAASDAARNPPKGACTLRREIPVVTVPRLPTRLELFTRADIANGRGALQADVGVGIFLHALAEHVSGMSVGIHLALGGQITQRIDGLDPYSGILVFHQGVKQSLANHFLRPCAIQRFKRLEAHRGIAVLANRAAKSSANIGIIAAGAETFDGIEPNIGAELLATGEDIEQHSFHIVVVNRALDHNGLLGLELQLHASGTLAA